jgi:hypothetical protein
VAYRSRSRPSSTLGAKASTVCPYYLDGDLAPNFQRRPFAKAFPVVEGPVIPVISRRLSMAADLWLLCSFQGPWRGMNAGRAPRLVWSHLRRRVLADTGGRRSLKTQQHAGVDCGRSPLALASSNELAPAATIQPGSVDMLGPICSGIAGLVSTLGVGGSATARSALSSDPGSGHR